MTGSTLPLFLEESGADGRCEAGMDTPKDVSVEADRWTYTTQSSMFLSRTEGRVKRALASTRVAIPL
jgi:hypothetical protein